MKDSVTTATVIAVLDNGRHFTQTTFLQWPKDKAIGESGQLRVVEKMIEHVTERTRHEGPVRELLVLSTDREGWMIETLDASLATTMVLGKKI